MAELQNLAFRVRRRQNPPRKSGKIRSVGSPQATRCNTSCLVGRFYVGYFALVRPEVNAQSLMRYGPLINQTLQVGQYTSGPMGRISIPIEVGLAFLSGRRASVHPMGTKAPEKGRHPFFTIDVLA